MDTHFFATDLAQLDQQSLEKIAQIAEQARRSLLMGIASIRNLDDPPLPTQSADSEQMVEQLSRLTLMWDEIHHRARQLLSDSPILTDQWQSLNKPPPVTLH